MPKDKSSAKRPTARPSNPQQQNASRQAGTQSAFARAMQEVNTSQTEFPNISGRWLLFAGLSVAAGALALAWLTLCLLYWQGCWQLLYHPISTITRTPASVGLPFETIHFATTETGQTQLTGWWIPKANSAHTVLYLHGADGNLSDSVDSLAKLHQQDVAIFAFDYRNYGQSATQPNGPRPSEKQLRQDAEWALTYLTLTRHVPPKQIVVYGLGLGANLAAELAADHSELAGVILDQPQSDPLAPLLHDPRSRLVPAHLLLSDKYDLGQAARALRIPSLWLIAHGDASSNTPQAYEDVEVRKSAVYLNIPIQSDPNYQSELKRWLDDL